MNKEKLEEMILEELMLEADAEVDEEYKTLAQKLFPNIARRQGGIDKLKTAFRDVTALEKEMRRLERAKIQIGSIDNENFDFNNDRIDGDQKDKELYNNIVNNRKAAVEEDPSLGITTFTDLLAAASEVSASERSATTEPTSEPTTEPTSEPTTEPTSEPTTEPTSEPTAEPSSPTSEPPPGAETADTADGADAPGSEEEVDPNLFVPTEDVKKAVEEMKGFYDKPYLYEQGQLLRDLIKAIEAALKGEDRTAGITRPSAVTTESLQEAKGLNIKNIKASLNAFLQQTRKVKKALQEFIAMAKEAKAGAKRKKGILDKEVDQLIEYGKMILKSLPKTISEADETETGPETAEESVNLQPLHDFINFIVGGKLETSNKDDIQGELENVKTILKVFPNVAPFGSADGPELNKYEDEFQKAINTHLKTAIANFKSLNSVDGGEVAIEGLRTALIQFLGNGLSILGKGVNGEDIENLGREEAIDPKDETAEVSDLSPEAIMAELGLDTSEEGKITTTSDEETAFKIMNSIFYRFQDERFNDLRKIENFIYDYVKKDEDNWLKKLAKGTLRSLPFMVRESNENQNFKDKFSENFINKIKEMWVKWKNNKNKNELRTAAKELAKYSNEMLTKYQTLSDNEGRTNTGAQLSNMFRDLYSYTQSKYNSEDKDIRDGFKSSETNKKVHKALKLINDNINKVDYKIFLKTLTKIDLKDLDDNNLRRIENISEKIFKKPHFIEHFKINSVMKDDSGNLVLVGTKNKIDNKYPTFPFVKDNLDKITTSISKWWNNLTNLSLEEYQKNDLVYTLLELKNEILEKKYEISENFEVGTITYSKREIVQITKIEEQSEGILTVTLKKENNDNSQDMSSSVGSLTHYLEMKSEVRESKNHKIQFKLEKLVENYINKRKQQWRKRTM